MLEGEIQSFESLLEEAEVSLCDVCVHDFMTLYAYVCVHELMCACMRMCAYMN